MTSSGQEDTFQDLPSHHTGQHYSMDQTSSTLKVLHLDIYSRSILGVSPPPLEEQEGLPDGWEAKRSPTATGRVFYVNHNQRRTTFERPGRAGGEGEAGPASTSMVVDLPVPLPMDGQVGS